MKKILPLVILLATVGHAQEKSVTSPTRALPPLPAVDEIIDRYITTIGGREALMKLTTRHVTGSFEIEGLNVAGDLEAYTADPDKSSSIVTVKGIGRFLQVNNGARAWASDPAGGLRELVGPELAASIRDHYFHRELNLRKLYTKLDVVGREKVGEATAYVVAATPPDSNIPEKLYFDADSYLLIRYDTDREGPQGRVIIKTTLSDFRVVDGVRIAHQTRQVSPAFTSVFRYDRIRHNLPIDESRFNKPSAP